jgi:hypothetical protein
VPVAVIDGLINHTAITSRCGGIHAACRGSVFEYGLVAANSIRLEAAPLSHIIKGLSKMSKPDVINTGNNSALEEFNRGASTRQEVDTSLQKRDSANREQNDAARSGRPVARD